MVRSHARVSSLTLKDIQYTDAGEYICVASNNIGQDSQAMYLEVQCKWRYDTINPSIVCYREMKAFFHFSKDFVNEIQGAGWWGGR